MKITVLTAFPEMIENYVSSSILGRAKEKNVITINIVNIRDFALDNYGHIDDYCYGRGGMLLSAMSLEKALESATENFHGGKKPFVVFPTPEGLHLNQDIVEDLAGQKEILIVCGHYEGLDDRFVERAVDLKISLGDFVVTGGELAAMAVIDSVARLLPNVVGRETSVTNDSFYDGMLDTPHYTRPPVWNGVEVPPVLLSGNEREIDAWRRKKSIERTLKARPDILARCPLDPWISSGSYIAEVHYPVLGKNGEVCASGFTGLDLHDIARAARTYGIKKYLLITPVKEQREMAQKIKKHWTKGWGASYNEARKDAFSTLKICASLEGAIEWVRKKEKKDPFTIATSAKKRVGSMGWVAVKRHIFEHDVPPLFLFGTSWGLAESVFKTASVTMSPLLGGNDGYNHLSVRSAVSIVLDRFYAKK
ncbi:MAG: tRNA (guanosine(37)-N1)-methyltransferase TrmD [Synergistaceae bacterium]|nr:tRNA (guanosine(37)-N1)-methyltransferase TrmD [Synergistaceae bacterium]